MARLVPRIFGILFLLFLGSSPVFSQVTTATISGVLRDESAAVLPGVSVTAKNLDTGQARTVISDDVGRYKVPELALGNYEVQAELAGFQTAIRGGIKLTLGREAIVDLTLKVGSSMEKVIVQGEAPLVETTSATLSGLVDDKKIRDLPLNGRSFTQLALLQEGVASPTNLGGTQPGNEGQKITISGTRVTQTAFLLDGSDIRSFWGTTPGSVAGVLLGVETVREFSVVTSAASAEYGGFTGGVVNAVTRSGTNELHGSVFEFLRNSAVDARNFFDRGQSPPPFKRNQFGFTVGGPIKKDKTFFFGSYEALRNRLTTTSISFVPEAGVHQGILGGATVGVDPKVKPYLDIYPAPNGRILGGGTGEYIFANAQPTNEHYFLVKIDQSLSESDSFYVRYTFDDGSKSNLSAIPAWVETRLNRNQYLSMEEKKIISSNLINQFRFALNRNNAGGDILSQVDPGLRFIPIGDRSWGSISIGGGAVTGWGPSSLPKLHQILNRFDYTDSLVYTSGRHSIKTGFSFSRLQFNYVNPVRAYGAYSFASLTDFLQARPFVFDSVVTPLITLGIRQSLVGMYVQDDFRTLPSLTLNLGLRYDFSTNPNEVAGRLSNLDNPLDATLRIGNPELARNPSFKSFGPRVGFAWDPFKNGKTSVRGGYGMFYDFVGPTMLLQTSFNPPFVVRVTPTNPAFPNAFSQVGDLSKVLAAVWGFGTVKQSYVMQYNLSLQREIAPFTVVTVGYQGSRGVHLDRFTDANIAIPQALAGRIFFPAPPATCPPLYGVPGCRRNPNFDQGRAYFFDSNSFYNAFRIGLSRRFNQGLQLQSSYTYARSIDDSSNTQAADGASSPNGVMNMPDDHKFDRSLSSFDVRHVYVFNMTYELPFGSGKPWGHNLTGAAGKLVSGWQASGIVSASTGLPVNIRLGFERSRSRAGTDLSERPDLVAGANNNPVLGGPDRYFDVNAFVLQPAGFFGNLGRNTVIGPGVATLDLSLVKNTSIHGEGKQLQFRAELFNLLNRPNFGQPQPIVFGSASGIPSANAARITTTTTTSRQVQFALKLIF